MGYDLLPRNKAIAPKNGMIFTWPVILEVTGAGYLFGYGPFTFDGGEYRLRQFQNRWKPCKQRRVRSNRRRSDYGPAVQRLCICQKGHT